jgi:hypothetical protein
MKKAVAVITGSSNLTASGLSIEGRSRNNEFNVLLKRPSKSKIPNFAQGVRPSRSATMPAAIFSARR